ncbi:MAG TPA: GAP family protein [Ktedonobacterales bacterium]|nr:GAP family protein [Ktedonobacterales bacterium]
MGSVLLQMIPLVIGSVMMPTWVLLVLVLLRKGRGPAEAIAFVSGIVVVKILQGLIFGTIFGAYDVSHHRSEIEAIIVTTLLIVVGLLMWMAALKLFIQGDDPDGPPPAWTRMVSAITPLKAFGLGTALVTTSSRSWLFTLAAIGIITQADLGPALSILAYLLYIAGTISLVATPIVLSISSARQFNAVAYWLQKHDRVVMIVASLIVGAFFIWTGVSSLLALG